MKTDKSIDIGLWNSFRSGDQRAFSQIYELYGQTLFRYGSKLSPDKEFVMDCIHDLFVDLSYKRKTIGETDNISFYLIRSLKNKMLNNRNILQKSNFNSINDYPFILNVAFDEMPDEQEAVKQKRRYLRDTLDKLPERQKEIIYLRYINDFSNEEISKIMGINNQVVRNTLHKAIENLRKSISKEMLLFFLMIIRNFLSLRTSR